jgi:hypothetical protein
MMVRARLQLAFYNGPLREASFALDYTSRWNVVKEKDCN